MKTLGNILVGIIIGIVLVVLVVGGGGYIILSRDGMMGTIDDSLDQIALDEEQRALSVLQYASNLANAFDGFSDKTIGEIERLVGTDIISYNLSSAVGVSSGVIKTSSFSTLGAALADNLTFEGMQDSFGIALPEDIPIFADETFLSRPVNEALAALEDYTLDSFISVVYDHEATEDNPASSGILQQLGTVKLSQISSQIDGIIDDTYIIDVIDVDENSSELLKYLASGAEGGNPFIISELDVAIREMQLSDAVPIDENSHAVMQSIADLTLDELGDGAVLQERINTLTLGEVMVIPEDAEPILLALKDTEIGDLNERIQTLQLQEVFADYDKGILSLIDPATPINDIASSITASVQATTLYALRAVGLFSYSVSGASGVIGDDAITAEALVRRLTVHNAEINDVVGAIGAGSLASLGFNVIDIAETALDGAEEREIDGVTYHVLTPALAEQLITLNNVAYGDVLSIANGINIILEGEYSFLFSLDMKSNDTEGDGRLLVGSETAPVSFPEKRGGYAYFSASNIAYYDGTASAYVDITGDVTATPDYIPTALTKVETDGITETYKLTLIQLIESLPANTDTGEITP